MTSCDRAELLYPERVGIIDEPDQPAPSWGSLTYAEVADRARALAAGLDALGIATGERVAIVSHNSARLITALFGVSGSGRILVPINFRLVAQEVAYIVEHSGASIAARRPRARRGAVRGDVRTAIGDRGRVRRHPLPAGRRAPTVGCRRVGDGDDQLHVGHDGAAQGGAAHPSQRVDQCHDVRLAHGRRRPRRVPAHTAAVPLQRVGDALRRHRDGCRARGAAQGRRRRDPATRRASTASR